MSLKDAKIGEIVLIVNTLDGKVRRGCVTSKSTSGAYIRPIRLEGRSLMGNPAQKGRMFNNSGTSRGDPSGPSMAFRTEADWHEWRRAHAPKT